jgi:hypothetical protein
MRFGKIRKTYTGYLEERLPFFYIWVPQKIQIKNPKIVENLMKNRDRLTSPYDVHITLKHILNMSGGDVELSAVSCPECQSLFEEIPLNRSCSDAGIDRHWCACSHFEEISVQIETVEKAVNYVIDNLNHQLSVEPKCSKLKLKKILSARRASQDSHNNYLVSFVTDPSNAELEATVSCDNECKDLKIIGAVSRLNRYGDQSYCVSDSELRKYCYCQL